MSAEIKEGFLCPICLKDLNSPTNLSSHFEEYHQNDGDVLQQVRSVFGKAKQKILKASPVSNSSDNVDLLQNQTNLVSNGTPGTGGIDLALWETQQIGSILTHTNTFRDRRKETIERRVVETNQLIIRLGKLVTSGIYNSDSKLSSVIKARKNIEKTCVPWQNDSEVKMCPTCSKKFTLTFRKHHCRLCGQIFCQLCFDYLDPILANNVMATSLSSSSPTTKLRSTKDPEDGMKVCFACLNLLERQNKLNQDKRANEVLIKAYDRMKAAMQNADLIQPTFLKMAESVNSGETTYSLQHTMETRHKLLKHYETVEGLSKHIRQLGIGNPDKEPGVRALKLQNSIRAFASSYLADNMFTLPSLPTQDKYETMLNKKERERDRIKEERMLIAAKSNSLKRAGSSKTTSPVSSDFNQQPSSFRATNNNKPTRSAVHAVSISKPTETSWGPTQARVDDHSDPIIQQIQIIESYLRQAREDGRMEEAQMFEMNLQELRSVQQQQSGIG